MCTRCGSRRPRCASGSATSTTRTPTLFPGGSTDAPCAPSVTPVRDAADQVTTPPRNSDVGGHHVALYVDDLDHAVQALRSAKIEVPGEPTVNRGPSEGQRWVYFRSPWGMQFELVSYPDGKAFDHDPDAFD